MLPVGLGTVAVEFDLVQPFAAGRRAVYQGGKLRRDEGRQPGNGLALGGARQASGGLAGRTSEVDPDGGTTGTGFLVGSAAVPIF